MNRLKQGDRPDGTPGYKPIGTNHHFYNLSAMADAYNMYAALKDTGAAGRESFRQALASIEERERTRFDYSTALMNSAEYKRMSKTEQEAFITMKLSATYNIVDNGGHRSIAWYGSTDKLRQLLAAQADQNFGVPQEAVEQSMLGLLGGNANFPAMHLGMAAMLKTTPGGRK